MVWETKRIKDFASLITEKTSNENKVALENIEEATGKFIETDSEFDGEGIHFLKGDVLYGKLRPYLRKVWLSNTEGNAVGDIFVFRNKKNSIPEYLKWLFLSEDFTSKCNGSTQGAKMPRVDSNYILTLSYELPSLEIQKKIAAFLDSKTQNIDKRIELLQKKKEHYVILRKAIINEVVNGDEKDWKICRMKDVFSFSKGLSITKADLVETGIPVISYGQIHSKQNKSVEIDDSLIRYVPESYLATEKNALTEQYDFIFADTSEDFEGCGNNVYVDRNETLFAGYHTIILRNRKHQDNKFLAYLFLSDSWRIQIRKSVCGIKVFSITQSDLAPVKIRIPPKAKQKQIVNYLDKKTSAIDSIVEKITKEIDTLKIYRRALVNEAVTGKLNIG